MSLSSRVKNKIVDAINTCFTSIGHGNGMKMPRSGNNLEPYAWELFVAKHVLRLAEKRKDDAETACAKAGVIVDKEKDPQPAGTREIIYSGDIVSISLEVRSAAPRVNAQKMADYLFDHGVKQSLLDDAIKAATSLTKPAHVFTPILITADQNGK